MAKGSQNLCKDLEIPEIVLLPIVYTGLTPDLPASPRTGVSTDTHAMRIGISATLTFWVLALCSCGSFFVAGNTVVTISLSPANTSLQVGSTTQYVATGTTANGTTEDVSLGATWSSSDIKIATVSSAGLATAVADGTATISAKYQDGTGQTFLVVTSATLTGITISPANSSINIGSTQQFTATGSYSDGISRNITGSVTWSSSNPSVATITSAGVATGVANGSTVITVTSGSISVTTTLTVS